MTEFCANSLAVTEFAAIAVASTEFAAADVVVVTTLVTTSIFPVPLGGASEKVSVVPLILYVPFG